MERRAQREDVPSNWMPYFGIDDINGALRRIPELGGRVLAGRMEMPSGSIAVFADPQGAVFALWSGDYDD